MLIEMQASAFRYWHTLRYLRPGQIANRLWRKVYRPRASIRGSTVLRLRAASWVQFATCEPSLRSADEFEFLGVQRRVTEAGDWNRPDWPALWRYHLHYFDDLNARDAGARTEWHVALVERWIDQNLPAVGVGCEFRGAIGRPGCRSGFSLSDTPR